MYGYGSPYSRGHSGGRSGQRQLFLLVVALACLAGYYAFSRHQVDRRYDNWRHVEMPHVASGAPIVGQAWVVDGDSLRIAGISIRLEGIDAPEWANPASTLRAARGCADGPRAGNCVPTSADSR